MKQQSDLETVLANYNQRRFQRVATLVEMSRQICEWERTHDPKADQMGVIKKALMLAAQPI